MRFICGRMVIWERQLNQICSYIYYQILKCFISWVLFCGSWITPSCCLWKSCVLSFWCDGGSCMGLVKSNIHKRKWCLILAHACLSNNLDKLTQAWENRDRRGYSWGPASGYVRLAPLWIMVLATCQKNDSMWPRRRYPVQVVPHGPAFEIAEFLAGMKLLQEL